MVLPFTSALRMAGFRPPSSAEKRFSRREDVSRASCSLVGAASCTAKPPPVSSAVLRAATCAGLVGAGFGVVSAGVALGMAMGIGAAVGTTAFTGGVVAVVAVVVTGRGRGVGEGAAGVAPVSETP